MELHPKPGPKPRAAEMGKGLHLTVGENQQWSWPPGKDRSLLETQAPFWWANAQNIICSHSLWQREGKVYLRLKRKDWNLCHCIEMKRKLSGFLHSVPVTLQTQPYFSAAILSLCHQPKKCNILTLQTPCLSPPCGAHALLRSHLSRQGFGDPSRLWGVSGWVVGFGTRITPPSFPQVWSVLPLMRDPLAHPPDFWKPYFFELGLLAESGTNWFCDCKTRPIFSSHTWLVPSSSFTQPNLDLSEPDKLNWSHPDDFLTPLYHKGLWTPDE